MATRIINKPTADPVVVPLNHKSWVDTKVSIYNDTGAALTITVTCQNTEGDEVLLFADPAEGALSIADASIGALQNPYAGLQAAGTGTGNIYIVEAY